MWVEKNGPVYRVRDLVGGKKVTIATGYPTKKAAKEAKTQLEADKLRGEALVPRGGTITLDAWIDLWWPSYEKRLKPSAAYSEGARVRNHIRPLLGRLTLDELNDALRIQSWVWTLSAGRTDGDKPVGPLAPKTVRNCHGILHKILDAAVRQKLIRTNPCAGTELPARVHREMRFLTEPEIARLVAVVPAHWRPLVLLMVSTGLRWGEAAGLRVGQLDLLARRLTVIRTMHEMPGSGEIVFTEPKSAMSRRTVTFPVSVAEALTPLVVDKVRDDQVFAAPRGGYVRVRNFRRGWVEWCAAAGLEPARAKGQRRTGGVRVHDLRHTHAAVLISAGVPLTAIQRRLGHASIAVTSDLYGHLLPQVDEGILTAVEASLALIDPAGFAAEVEAELAAEV